MEVTPDIVRFLEGREFSNGLDFPLDGLEPPRDRIEVLVEAARGRRVLHLGCIDHLPIVGQKIREGRWLHARLSEVAADCLGIDIDADAVRAIRDQFGVTNVVCADLASGTCSEVMAGEWDLMILGEVVEHIGSPVGFLRAMRENLAGRVREILVTVPSAWDVSTLRRVWRGVECVNSDHKFWFTPYTLAKVLTESGYRVKEFSYALTGPPNGGGVRAMIYRRLLCRRPYLAPHLVMRGVAHGD